MPTPFQEDVYKALEKIPKGSVTTYGAIANYLGTKAVRAVGTAVSLVVEKLVTILVRVV